MSKAPIKYNPAFLTDEQLADAFVVRHDDLKIVMKVVQENTVDSNQHVLVIGPRGIGKTMLMRRATLEVRQNEELEKQWYPLVFAEESYEVCSAGEFWLEALFHLANQTGDNKWTLAYEELRQERDEDRLEQRAVAQLMDFADSQRKKILLVVENLNMILGSQIDDDCAWKLRHRLMHESRVMLLATATAELDLPANTSKAFYEMFKTHTLQPLDDNDCQAVWTAIAGHELGPRRIRALSILTGGNPRLLTIISYFGAQLSFSDLMQDLTALVDDHTDYFKSHLEALPATERKVYVALADLWDPSLAREVAEACRLEVSKTSSLLKRLVSRGAVTEVPAKEKGKKRYRVTERMYNVYYLMRRRGAPSERVRAAVHFMVQFYEEKEILEITKRLGEEACELLSEERQNHYYAVEGILKTVAKDLRPKILECVPKALLTALDCPRSLKENFEKSEDFVDALLEQASVYINEMEDAEKVGDKTGSINALSSLEKLLPGEALKAFCRAMTHECQDQYELAEAEYLKVLESDPEFSMAWSRVGFVRYQYLDRYDEAEDAFRKAFQYGADDAWVWQWFGQLKHMHLKRYDSAEDAYRSSLKHDPKWAFTWALLGELLRNHTGRFKEAEEAYRNALKNDSKLFLAWVGLGDLLVDTSDRHAEAEQAYRRAIELEPDSNWAVGTLARLLLVHTDRYEEAEQAYLDYLKLAPNNSSAWHQLGIVRRELGNHIGEAEAYHKAVELDQSNIDAWCDLVSFELVHHSDVSKALGLANQALQANPESAPHLNSLAWDFYEDCSDKLPAEVVGWSRRAVELKDEPTYTHTLACVLGRSKQYDESLSVVSGLLGNIEFVEAEVDYMTTLFAEFVAGGQAKAAIPILRDSKSAVVLEPILVALRMSVGEEVAVAPEIEQIALDVLKEFDAMKEKRAKSK